VPETTKVFVLMIEAVAAEGCGHPVGELRHLLVMVPAQSEEEAVEPAMRALADGHWSQGQVRRLERFRAPPESLPPPLDEAAAKAFAGDPAIVVFDKP
jgi:hypothetical protein